MSCTEHKDILFSFTDIQVAALTTDQTPQDKFKAEHSNKRKKKKKKETKKKPHQTTTKQNKPCKQPVCCLEIRILPIVSVILSINW